jgi:hypothetical protein
MKKLILLTVGGAVGYVRGARAGRPAYDRMSNSWQALTRRSGLDDLASTAKSAAVDVRDVAAERASTAMSKGADDLAQRIDSLAPNRGNGSAPADSDLTHPTGV